MANGSRTEREGPSASSKQDQRAEGPDELSALKVGAEHASQIRLDGRRTGDKGLRQLLARQRGP